MTIPFKYMPISNKKQIGSKRSHNSIKYIVIHDTGNTSRGANAMAHYRYLQSATRYGSAHYYLDDKEIIQTIGDSFTAWSIGDSWGYKSNPNRVKDAKNSNTISIELCINSDGNYEKAYQNLVELTKNLMVKFNIPASRVIRHFDATGKTCPGSFSKNNWGRWKQFKSDIQKPMKIKFDLSKSSVGVPVGETKPQPKPEEPKKEENMSNKKDYEGHWAEKQIKEIIERGIMTGFEDGSFKPNDPVTRAQLAVVITRLFPKK